MFSPPAPPPTPVSAQNAPEVVITPKQMLDFIVFLDWVDESMRNKVFVELCWGYHAANDVEPVTTGNFPITSVYCVINPARNLYAQYKASYHSRPASFLSGMDIVFIANLHKRWKPNSCEPSMSEIMKMTKCFEILEHNLPRSDLLSARGYFEALDEANRYALIESLTRVMRGESEREIPLREFLDTSFAIAAVDVSLANIRKIAAEGQRFQRDYGRKP